MPNKTQILTALEEVGVFEFSMSNSKDELLEAYRTHVGWEVSEEAAPRPVVTRTRGI